MKLKIFSIQKDAVIDSVVALGETDFKTAIADLYPLINKFDSQRKTQDQRFYEKLKRDLIHGCVIPPITIAFITKNSSATSTIAGFEKFVNANLSKAFILDGIQRLNTIYNASQEIAFSIKRKIYINVVVCESEDKLLYRMITLNNGQRPMTPRHQVEVMMNNVLKIDTKNIKTQTEKERAEKVIRGAFKYSDVIQAYLAFITNSVSIDNNKIIDEKMDQLLVGRILDNEPKNYKVKFESILDLMEKFCKNSENKAWFRIPNNMIGFCVGTLKGFDQVKRLSSDDFSKCIINFEESFAGLEKSKLKLGRVRKELVQMYIEKIDKYQKMDSLSILEEFGEALNE